MIGGAPSFIFEHARQRTLLVLSCLLGWFAAVSLPAGEPPTFSLAAETQVDSAGIFLEHVLSATNRLSLPRCRLADAPAAGVATILTRAQIQAALAHEAPALTITNWNGPNHVRVTRRIRVLPEAEVREQLTATLQRELLRDRGELELRFSRAWGEVKIPDEVYVLKVVELPATGINASMIVRFELRHENEALGSWQVAVQAKIWREVYTARTALKRGDTLAESDLARERRDVLALRDTLDTLPGNGSVLEIQEGLAAGAPLTTRSLRLKPVVARGQLVAALATSGALTISLKVETLEDGAPGQWIRVRNPDSKRELRGKVQDEQTILITL